MAIPIGPKVAHLATVLQRSGAQVVVTAPDPHFIQEDTAVALASRGVIVYGSRQQADEEVYANFEAVLAHQPDLLLDDRAHLVTLISTTPQFLVGRLRGASEQTTTGVIRLRALERDGRLKLPVVVANDARCKHMFDNRYGTGQSILSTLLDTTNLFLGGKVVVVAGYGWVGRGVAMRIRGMHGRVIVTEVDPVRGLEALADGFQVMRMDDAAPLGDVFITCAGAEAVISARHFQQMRNNVLLVNAGALESEVEVNQLGAMAQRRHLPRPGIESFELANGHQLHLLADGRVANVAAGEGHPVEIMDLTYAVQAMSLYHLAQAHGRLVAGLHRLPAAMDEEIARLALKANGGDLDGVTVQSDDDSPPADKRKPYDA